MSLKTSKITGILKETVIPGGIILNALRGQLTNRPKESDLPKDMADSMSTAHTIADDLVQEVALEILKAHGSEFRINAEEKTPRVSLFEGNESSYCYHLDPLDGTFSYLKGKDGFCVGAAFSKGLQFEASALYFPARNLLYLAERGKGIQVQDGLGNYVEFKRKQPATSRYVQRRCEDLIPIAEALNLMHLDTMGAHDGMLAVAKGDARFLVCRRASPHDFGIPQVLIEEAGGICTDVSGNPVEYDEAFNRVPVFLAFYDLESKEMFFDTMSRLSLHMT